MNNIFKVVWNKSLNMLVVASELAKHAGGIGDSSVAQTTHRFKYTKIATSLVLLLGLGLSSAAAENLKDLLNNGQTEGVSSNRAFYYTSDSFVTKDLKYTLNFSAQDSGEREIKWINNGGKAGTTSWTIDNSELMVNGRFYTGVNEAGGLPADQNKYYTKLINGSKITFNEWVYIGGTTEKFGSSTKFIVHLDNGSQLTGQPLSLGLFGGLEIDNHSIVNVSSTNTYPNPNVQADSPREYKGYIRLTNGGTLNIGNKNTGVTSYDNLRLEGDATGVYNFNRGKMQAYTSNPDYMGITNIGSSFGTADLFLHTLDAYGNVVFNTHQKSTTHLLVDGAFQNIMVGGGALVVSSHNIFDRAQTQLSGNVKIEEKGSAIVNVNHGLSNNNTIQLESSLTFGDGKVTEFTSNLTGQGLVNVGKNNIKATGVHGDFKGTLNVATADSTWNLQKKYNYDFYYQLKGAGNVNISAGSDAQKITFKNQTKDQAFTGRFTVERGTLQLDQLSEYALGGAYLGLLPKSTANVMSNLSVARLGLDNSQLYVLNNGSAFNLLTSKNGIALTGNNTIIIDDAKLLGQKAAIDHMKPTGTLLDQQNQVTLGETFVVGQTSGDRDSVTLTAKTGDVNAHNVYKDIVGQEAKGQGIYGYQKMVADDVGIHAGYGLKALSANQNQSVTIDSTGAKEQKLFVKLTGAGGFTFTGVPLVTVTGAANDYQGTTALTNAAKVALGADQALGQKGALTLAGQSQLDLGTHAQNVASVTASKNTQLNLNAGTLTLTDNQVHAMDGQLKGTQQSALNVQQGTLKVGASNEALASQVTLGKQVTADLAKADALGKGNLTLDGANTVNINGAGTLANAIKGDGTTAVNLNQGEVTLNGDNSALAGKITIAKTATANITAMNNLGSGALDVEGKLNFTNGVNGDLNNGITGAGQITLTDNQINVKGEHNGFIGTLTTGDEATWNVSSDAPYDVNYALSGTGTVSVDANGDIALKNVGAKDFTGNFTVKGGNAQLDQTAFDVLNNASLNLAGGAATVTVDGQYVDNLVIHNGTLSLDPKDPNASNHLKVTDTITLIGDKNAIQVDKETVDKHVTDATAGQVDQKTSFLDQQEGFVGETLVSGKVVTKDNAGNPIDDFEAIFLRDRDGNLIESKDVAQSSAVIQNGAGEAFYGFNGLRTDDKGIHLNYGLDEIEAYDGKVVTVKSDQSNVTTNSRDLRVELVGKGGFTFTGDQGITLSGNPNTYTGNTIIDDTVITAGMDNVFGQQGDLTLKGQSTFDLAGMKQSVDNLQLGQQGVIDLNQGELTLAENSASTVSGQLLGNDQSKLNINAGTVNVESSNSGLNAAVTLNQKAAATLAKVDGFGQGNVTLNDESALTLKGAGQFNNTLAGTGTLTIDADSVTLHKDNSQFTGTVKVTDQGTANVDALNSLGSAAVDVAGTLNINDDVKGDLNNVISGAGTIALGKGSDLNVKGEHGALTGTVKLADQSAWNITTDAPYDLNYALSGAGTVSVDANGDITLKNAGVQDFTGEFAVKDGELTLDQTGFDVLTNASVSLVGGDASLQLDDQSLKNLTFNQGVMTLQTKDTNDRVNHLNVTGLVTLEGQNNSLRVDPTKLQKTEFDQKVDTSLSFLDQQEGFTGETLIKGQVVKQGNADIHLADLQGQQIDNDAVPQSAVTIQEGAGQAFYGFNGLRTDDQGIHLNYGLSVIEAYQGKQVEVLSSSANVITDSRDLRAELKGEGGFTFKGNLGIEVSNGKNSYTGNTVIDGAVVTAGANNVFGEKGALSLLNQGQFYLNGQTQTVDQLVMDEGTRLDFNSGTLTLNDQKTSDIKGALFGDQSATLNMAKGTVNVDSINKEFVATVNVDDAVVNLNQLQGLGHGQLNLADKAVVNIADQGDWLNTIAGSGQINVTPTGQVAVKGQHDAFKGTVNVAEKGSWNITTDAPYDLNYALSGAGTVSVDAKGDITLKNAGAKDFTGEFAVKGGELSLDQTAFDVLDQAHVNLAGGEANLTLDGQTLKNLTFDQGAMTLQKDANGQRSNHLTVSDTITLVGDQNLLKVDLATIEKHGIDAANVDQKTSFLDQQFGMVGETLISGKVITKDANNGQVKDYEGIFLADMDGNLIESKDVAQSSAVIQNGAGEAFYGFNGLRTDDKGIHLNYGLDEIEAFKDKNVMVLSDASNTTTDSRDLRAELKG